MPRNPEWTRAIVEQIKDDPEKALEYLETFEEPSLDWPAVVALVKLVIDQQSRIQDLEAKLLIISGNPQTLEKALTYLSFLEKHKYAIEIATYACQIIGSSKSFLTWLIASIISGFALYEIALKYHWF